MSAPDITTILTAAVEAERARIVAQLREMANELSHSDAARTAEKCARCVLTAAANEIASGTAPDPVADYRSGTTQLFTDSAMRAEVAAERDACEAIARERATGANGLATRCAARDDGAAAGQYQAMSNTAESIADAIAARGKDTP